MKRVLIVYPFPNLDSVPCLINTALLLARGGYGVDIFTLYDNQHVNPTFDHPRITVLPLNPRRDQWPPALRFMPGRIYYALGLLFRRLRYWQSPYICIIGVDPEGLVKAQGFNRWIRASLVYFSLELLLSYEIESREHRKLKEQERVISRQAAFVIIQDDERGEILVRDNDLQPDKVIVVPNSPLGCALIRRSNYLREKYDLPANAKVILYTGSLSAWACLHQLVHSTREWPENWVLVCHGRSMGINLPYFEALKCLAKPGQVIFSTEPVSKEEYPDLVQSADIGVAFYCHWKAFTTTQDNIRYLGLSSGKLAYYLWAGIPVIMNTYPSTHKLVTSYGCGEVTDDPSRTRDAIERIFYRYETYCQKAVECFNSEMDFESRFWEVLAALERL